MAEEKKCIAGCKAYDGGEIYHHGDCPFYPDSISRLWDLDRTRLAKFDILINDLIKEINNMIPYDILIKKNLPGVLPNEKFSSLTTFKSILRIIAFPMRGTSEEETTISEIAKMIQEKFSLDDLEKKGV